MWERNGAESGGGFNLYRQPLWWFLVGRVFPRFAARGRSTVVYGVPQVVYHNLGDDDLIPLGVFKIGRGGETIPVHKGPGR